MATTRIAIATMKVAQISKPGGEFEIVEREIPKPRRGEVRIKVQACGICHSDVVTKEGGMSVDSVSPRSRTRSWGSSRTGRRCLRMEAGTARRRWLARRPRRRMSLLQARRFSKLQECKNSGHQLRRRLSAVHGGSCHGARNHSGKSRFHRSSAFALRWNHDIQLAAPRRRSPRRSCRGAGDRRSWSPRHSVRAQVRLQSGGHRTRSRECVSRRETRSPRLH